MQVRAPASQAPISDGGGEESAPWASGTNEIPAGLPMARGRANVGLHSPSRSLCEQAHEPNHGAECGPRQTLVSANRQKSFLKADGQLTNRGRAGSHFRF